MTFFLNCIYYFFWVSVSAWSRHASIKSIYNTHMDTRGSLISSLSSGPTHAAFPLAEPSELSILGRDGISNRQVWNFAPLSFVCVDTFDHFVSFIGTGSVFCGQHCFCVHFFGGCTSFLSLVCGFICVCLCTCRRNRWHRAATPSVKWDVSRRTLTHMRTHALAEINL